MPNKWAGKVLEFVAHGKNSKYFKGIRIRIEVFSQDSVGRWIYLRHKVLSRLIHSIKSLIFFIWFNEKIFLGGKRLKFQKKYLPWNLGPPNRHIVDKQNKRVISFFNVQWRAIQTALLPVYDVKWGHFERAKMTLKMLPAS